MEMKGSVDEGHFGKDTVQSAPSISNSQRLKGGKQAWVKVGSSVEHADATDSTMDVAGSGILTSTDI
ncbi:hypothetical protein OsJ_17779 [Oryza sativa Japonica Group]|uniref:Uncharacterized protein n=1 Tax=Oryza sativa subsp. japonica TaxID=39947 RepID=B9FJL6_ORYSJ|nr:hypothetical protein OsJ_17779 [Oryza sativa Japonica Group]